MTPAISETQLKKYAELLVRAGGNVQKGQPVVIACDVADAEFGRMVQDYAYDAGASEVYINWGDDASTRTRYLRAGEAAFDTFPGWIAERFKFFDDKNAVYLRILSDDPDLLSGVNPDRIRRYTKAMRQGTQLHSKLTMSNAIRWSLLATPSPAWAQKVFPGREPDGAVALLWQAILKGARADGPNPIQDWEAHRQTSEARKAHLNAKQFDAIRFTTGLGTDLTVGLADSHNWGGGGDVGQDGVPFFPNLPTEEVFTAPHKARAEGTVVASMPLSYQGSLIEDFRITFKEGRAVSFSAKKNEDILRAIIEMDEGSHYLGEVALVSNRSPISEMNLLFYNTLFDENASCHLALGKAYPHCVKGGEKMDDAALEAAGLNDSLLHVDFMFGTPDLKAVGISKDGTETVIMEHGDYCFP